MKVVIYKNNSYKPLLTRQNLLDMHVDIALAGMRDISTGLACIEY